MIGLLPGGTKLPGLVQFPNGNIHGIQSGVVEIPSSSFRQILFTEKCFLYRYLQVVEVGLSKTVWPPPKRSSIRIMLSAATSVVWNNVSYVYVTTTVVGKERQCGYPIIAHHLQKLIKLSSVIIWHYLAMTSLSCKQMLPKENSENDYDNMMVAGFFSKQKTYKQSRLDWICVLLVVHLQNYGRRRQSTTQDVRKLSILIERSV